MKSLSRNYEIKLSELGFARIVGIDEAGRGAWAGPIVAAGVIFDPSVKIKGLNDSKKLTSDNRNELAPEIREKSIAHVVLEISNQDIDEKGIGWANAELIRRIITQLNPDYALIDKAWVDGISIPHELIIKGDAKVFSIAAASVLAKTYRDQIMDDLDKQFPGYNFSHNKGYGTKDHQEALVKLNHCSIHRMSYQPILQPKLI